MKNPYDVLGVPQDASVEEIKKAYKKLALEWHPDRHQGDKDVENKFKEINEAYDLIKNGDYNNVTSRGGFNPFGGFNIYEDFLNVHFSRSQGARRKSVSIKISIEDAHKGGVKKVKLSEITTCSNCKGAGSDIMDVPCPSCNGGGQIRNRIGAIFIAKTCDRCKGLGKTLGARCVFCFGIGKKENIEELDINIPPGILQGQKIYPRKDLEIVILYSSHHLFKLIDERGSVGSNIEINMFDALLGTNVDVQTLNGTKKMKINEGTQPGTVLRIKNGGIGGIGDHFINISIILPKNLTESQKEILVKLQEAMGDEK